MGFSKDKDSAGSVGNYQPGQTEGHNAFKDILSGYFKSHFPIASGVAGAVGLTNQSTPNTAAVPQEAVAPAVSMDTSMPQQTDLIGMNAVPKKSNAGSFLKALLGA